MVIILYYFEKAGCSSNRVMHWNLLSVCLRLVRTTLVINWLVDSRQWITTVAIIFKSNWLQCVPCTLGQADCPTHAATHCHGKSVRLKLP